VLNSIPFPTGAFIVTRRSPNGAGLVEGHNKTRNLQDTNQFIFGDLVPQNIGVKEKGVRVHNNLRNGKGTRKKEGSVLQEPLIILEYYTIGPQTYVSPYTRIGDHTTIRNTEI